MSQGANAVHYQLRSAMEDYIKSQYFGKSPLLLSALNDKLDEEGILYRKPFIESSPAYTTAPNGIAKSSLPSWMKEYFGELSAADLGVFTSPYSHQIEALESASAGEDVFVATGTGSGKTECFMWPLMAKLAEEARNRPDDWSLRGVRVMIMYPMNALVSDQLSRLRRLIGDNDRRFVRIFRKTCGEKSRRPQFGMYTGRTPYPGPESTTSKDRQLKKTYAKYMQAEDDAAKKYLSKLIEQGRLPAKENFEEFLDKLGRGDHTPNPEDAELVTRFEMQNVCPDILITNYSMLEYMLLRPIERNIWDETRIWLENNPQNKLLFIIDEAHMYRGSAGGEVSYLLRRLFNRLGIGRDRIQFVLTTASMPDRGPEDDEKIQRFANELTACDSRKQFVYLKGCKEKMEISGAKRIPPESFLNSTPDEFESGNEQSLSALNKFWAYVDNAPVPFKDIADACAWMYERLADYLEFAELFQACRGTAVSLQELADMIFPEFSAAEALHAVSVLLAIAPLARKKSESGNGSVLFPARMHMLFKGIRGVYACTNPTCSMSHTDGKITLGEIYLDDGRFICPHCQSVVYELYNDRRCGSLFFKGYVNERDIDNRNRTYLWHYPGETEFDAVTKEIHLFIPEPGVTPRQNSSHPVLPCYLDIKSGFVDFSDDSLDGKPGIRKLYYSNFEDKGRPNILTFYRCPHCERQLSKAQLTSFSTRGNQPFFNLIKAQFMAEPPVPEKAENPNLMPNEGRKVLLFSDSRQRAAKLARDMADLSDTGAERQLAGIALSMMEEDKCTLNYSYGYFACTAFEKNVHLYHGEDQLKLLEDGKSVAQSRKRRRRIVKTIDNAPDGVKKALLKYYCGGYNTLIDSALSWIEPEEDALCEALDELEDTYGIEATSAEFLEIFNAWMLQICDDNMALGHTILNSVRADVRRLREEPGIDDSFKFSTSIKGIMGWKDDNKECMAWSRVLRKEFLDKSQEQNINRYFVDLSTVRPRFDLSHTWYKCEKCSEITPYTLRCKCPSCGSAAVHEMTAVDYDALSFWRQPVLDALQGGTIRDIDTEEHTAQLSHKDQRDNLWSKTEEYELRFQDFLRDDETPVDILSSTTTMEVGIDIGSLVAVGLRNIPPMRENYQQRAGRAGRRGSSLSTIVTFCEDGPHDSHYFANPVPMFRGEPRSPWIDIESEKIIQRHLNLVMIRSYLDECSSSVDTMSAAEFVDTHLERFQPYAQNYSICTGSPLIPPKAADTVDNSKTSLLTSVYALKVKRDTHPELFEQENGSKSLLDALYEEGIIPTYSFPKNVVSTYIAEPNGEMKYQVERGLDVAIGEYAPGRAIVVDKDTYQIGGLLLPASVRRDRWRPAERFMNDPNYNKQVLTCPLCNWFGLLEDGYSSCPFCGNDQLVSMRRMLRPWGFAPVNGEKTRPQQLEEQYSPVQQPLYSTLPEADDMTMIAGCKNISMAVRANQRIIMLNKGAGDKGFMVCPECGAAVPGDDGQAYRTNRIGRPYRGKYDKGCKHSDAVNVNLGYDFVTDMLVLQIELDGNKLDIDQRKSSWLGRAGQSIAEALRLAACQELDIEFTELVTGYRIRQNARGNYVEIYLYDSLSSGAGYAVSVAENIEKLFERTRELLESCSCDDACEKCLKHYRNQHIHGYLDRYAAIQLLDWAICGKIAPPLSNKDQLKLIRPLTGILSLVGLTIKGDKEVFLNKGGVRKKLSVYPAMWHRPNESDTVFVSDNELSHAKPYALQQIETAMG